jgi:hypothetical protein
MLSHEILLWLWYSEILFRGRPKYLRICIRGLLGYKIAHYYKLASAGPALGTLSYALT